MRTTLPTSTLLLSLLAALVSCSESSESIAKTQILKFTAIPNQSTTLLAQRFAPLAQHLSKVLGVKIEYVPAVDYPASVELFKHGDVHLSWFGGLTGVRARLAVPGARVIAQGKVDPHFKSYFIANRDSGLEPGESFPMALAGRKFTFGSDSSTSGRLMPEYFIRKLTGKSPEEFFGVPMSFSGSHDKTAALVESGAFDAGALDYKVYERLVAEGKLDKDKCRILWVTPEFPDYHWLAHPRLETMFGAGFIDRLQQALVAITDPELLAAMDRPEGLILAGDHDFAVCEETARASGLVR